MSFHPMNNLPILKSLSSVPVRALALGIAVLAAPLSGLSLHSQALAADFDFSQKAQGDDTPFLRLGMGKSAVIKLPGNAKDVVAGSQAIVDVAIRNKNTAYLFGQVPGQTNIFFFDADGQEILQLDLEVAIDSKAIKKLIDRTIPGNNIQVETADVSVILKGTAANAAQAETAVALAMRYVPDPKYFVNAMKIAEGDQVMLKVKVVEVRRDIAKTFGVNLRAVANLGDLAVAGATANPTFGALAALNYANGDVSIDAAIRAMEDQGVLRTLAEPTLVSISGQRAQFHAGGQFATGNSCRGQSGSGTTSTTCGVDFKAYGVSVGFTPTVLSEGRISLKIVTDVSEINSTVVGGIPGVDSRAVETTLELPSGGSMMLAGLIKDDVRQNLSGTPGLKELPVLGSLFRSRSYRAGQSELAIIVTPYIVKAVGENELVMPDHRYAPPTDRQQILFGRLNKIYGTAGKNPNGVYHGNVGYIIE